MEIEDLMTRDWVSFRGKPVRIEEISRPTQKVCVSTPRMVAFPKVFEIEPILITPEILEKNGFNKNPDNSGFILVCNSVHLTWGFYKNCLSISDWDYGGDNQISSVRCLYVHTLQHILRLCRIDKKIIL